MMKSAVLMTHYFISPESLTSTTVFLLLVDAVLDAVKLLVDVLVSSDLAEDPARLLGQPSLDEPARALRQEEETKELDHGRHHRKTQHVPGDRGGGEKKDVISTFLVSGGRSSQIFHLKDDPHGPHDKIAQFFSTRSVSNKRAWAFKEPVHQ